MVPDDARHGIACAGIAQIACNSILAVRRGSRLTVSTSTRRAFSRSISARGQLLATPAQRPDLSSRVVQRGDQIQILQQMHQVVDRCLEAKWIRSGMDLEPPRTVLVDQDQRRANGCNRLSILPGILRGRPTEGYYVGDPTGRGCGCR
ncbi:MAG: hypothetical protein KatS3mg057_0733 [Herpetosiphonaceae bacterium]|nr:MAG: hypothetical protein KatS3mg057_0733 [Herpetosiphonaceae bacterium]